MTVKTGIGFDAHRFAEGRALRLGGVELPHGEGLAGHSDGDVLCHAICDALLGAAGLGDLGDVFPANERWRDAAGPSLLVEVRRLLEAAVITHVDAVVVGERPRIAEFRAAMRETVASALAISPAAVSIKATTTDGMGFTGRSDGLAAMAVATIEL